MLGFSEDDGIRKRMRQTATGIERLINEDMGWLAKTDSQKLLLSLLIMRRYESDYRLTRTSIAKSEFFAQVTTFNDAAQRDHRRRNHEAKPQPGGEGLCRYLRGMGRKHATRYARRCRYD